MAAWEVIFFDAGGTLLEPTPSIGAIYADVAREFDLELDPETTQAAFDQAFAAQRDAALAQRGLIFGHTPAAAWEFWRRTLLETFDHLGGRPPVFEALFDRLYEEFADARRYALIDGALETLELLRSRGLRTGMISNWDHRLRSILRGLGLAARLDPIIVSCEARAEKPDPTIYLHACATAGVEPARALMVGDAPLPDVEGPRAAGMAGLLLDRTGWYDGPLPCVGDLMEVPAYIGEHER